MPEATEGLRPPVIDVEPVTPDRWEDMRGLFERPGPRGGTPIPGNCWCWPWRGKLTGRSARRDAMNGLVASGAEPGMLAYVDGEPMGWIAIAPRHEHPVFETSRTMRPRDADDAADDRVFSITCFYVDTTVRGDGVSSALLDAAIARARERGATAVEGYPKAAIPRHAQAGGRAEQNESFTGRRGMFERRGFRVVRETGARVVVRLDLH